MKFIACLLVVLSSCAIDAQKVDLGTASHFALLWASAVTSTGSSTLNGDLGISPGTAITGFPPGIVNGVTNVNDAVAIQAQEDALNAFNVAAGLPSSADLSGQDLGGLNLVSGTYRYDTSAQLTGILVLDGGNDESSVFVFQVGSTLTTATGTVVQLQNGAKACNIFWQIGSSATIGTSSIFVGNILAKAAITLNTKTTTDGGLYALTAAITLDQNDVSQASCGTAS